MGSGDGRVVLLASLFTKAEGFETNKFLINIGKRIRNKLKLKAEFFNEDFEKADFSDYDVLFIYADKQYSKEWFLKKNFKGILIMYKTFALETEHKKLIINDFPIHIYDFS